MDVSSQTLPLFLQPTKASQVYEHFILIYLCIWEGQHLFIAVALRCKTQWQIRKHNSKRENTTANQKTQHKKGKHYSKRENTTQKEKTLQQKRKHNDINQTRKGRYPRVTWIVADWTKELVRPLNRKDNTTRPFFFIIGKCPPYRNKCESQRYLTRACGNFRFSK